MGIEIDILLTHAAQTVDEGWSWGRKGMWLYAVAFAEGAIQLLSALDAIIGATGKDLEPDEETRYVAIRENIDNLLHEAARISGNGKSKRGLHGSTNPTGEFSSLVKFMLRQNSGR